MHTPSLSNEITAEFIDAMVLHLKSTFKVVSSIILENAGNIAYKDKLDGSPITEIDKQVENIILASFRAIFPEVPIFGEESGYSDDLPDFFWLIDPIDGTKSFIEGIPAFTSMAVFIANEEVLASIIYNPSTDEMFVAQKGKGAFRNNEKLNLSQKPLPATAGSKGRYFEYLNSIMASVHVSCELAPVGAGYGFARIAEGKTAARFQLNSGGYIHDYATGALLVKEAGGAIIPIKEKTYTFRSKSFVACHPALTKIIENNIDGIRNIENLLR